MRKYFFFFCFSIYTSSFCYGSTTQNLTRKTLPKEIKSQFVISVIVNNQVITERDVQERLLLINLTSDGKKGNSSSLPIIQEQVKKGLVDELIRLQVANQHKITATQEEINNELLAMAQRNGQSLETMVATLKKENVFRTLSNRIKAEIAWTKLVREFFSPLVVVSNKKIEERYKKYKNQNCKDQYRFSEIFLRVDNPSQEQKIKENASKLYDYLKKDGDFDMVERQLSQKQHLSASLLKTKDTGWCIEESIEPCILEFFKKATPGDISHPIKVKNGYKITRLNDVKKAGKSPHSQLKVQLEQVLIPQQLFSNPLDAQQVEEDISYILTSKSYEEFKKKSREKGYGEPKRFEMISLSQLPKDFQTLVKSTPVNTCIPKPVYAPDGVYLIMVSKKESPIIKEMTLSDIKIQLLNEELMKIANRRFSELLSQAYIEYK